MQAAVDDPPRWLGTRQPTAARQPLEIAPVQGSLILAMSIALRAPPTPRFPATWFLSLALPANGWWSASGGKCALD
jgi:hypothetical protein